MLRIMAVLLALTAAGAGIVVLSWTREIDRIGTESRSWPTVPGEIVESRLKEDTDPDSIRWSPQLSFRYEVGARSLTSSRIAASLFYEGREGAQAIVDRYPVGRQVEVHYDPAAPEVAVLETGTSPTASIFRFVAYSLFLPLPIVILVASFLVAKRGK